MHLKKIRGEKKGRMDLFFCCLLHAVVVEVVVVKRVLGVCVSFKYVGTVARCKSPRPTV